MKNHSAQADPGGVIDRHSHSGDGASKERRSDAAERSATSLPILLSDEQAAAYLGVSTRKFHYMRDEPWMPRPFILGSRFLKWSRAELENAVINMPRLSLGTLEPAQLLRARIERMKRGGAPE